MLPIELQSTLIEISESEHFLEAYDFFTKEMRRRLIESENLKAIVKSWRAQEDKND